MALEFRLLGTVEARVDGCAFEVGPARQRCVLAVLLVEPNEPVSTDQLVERVWADRAPHRARETLRTYLTRLRRALAVTDEVRIGRRAGGYVLTLDPDVVDLHRFRRLAAEARSGDGTAFERALALWRGEPFAGLDSEWINAVRSELDAERAAVELDHADLLLRAGRHAELLTVLPARTAERPLDERLAAQLLLALYRSGRQAAALAHYEQMRARLAEELGADPSPPLRRLHQQILTGDTALDGPRSTTARAPVPRQLPAPPQLFTGRTAELRTLTSVPGARTFVIAAIGGTGGMGKTWLALHWAHQHLDQFPDGQLYVNLRGFDATARPLPPAVAVRSILDALGTAPNAIPPDPDAQAALYRSLVAGKRMLVLLDNAAGTGQVLPLLPGSTSCTVLITSRHKLTNLITLHGARPMMLGALSDDEARALLTLHLGTARLDAEPMAVHDLLRHCAGLPLALGIVAARAATHAGLPLSVLAKELRDHRLDALDTGEDDLNLRTVLSWSLHALPAEVAGVFVLMALAWGPDISLPAVVSLTGQPASRTRNLVRELENAHLVHQHVPGRYRIHDLVRLYGRERAERDLPDDVRSQALRRLIDFYLHTAENAALQLYPQRDRLDLPPPPPGVEPEELGSYDEGFAWFEAERAVLTGAIDLAVDARWDLPAWQLPWTLATYFDRTGRWDDLLHVQRTALAAATRLSDVDGQARASRMLGQVLVRMGRHDEAHPHLRQAVRHYAELGNRVGQAHTSVSLSWSSETQGDHRAAIAHGHRALDLYRAAGHAFGHATALNIIGWCHAQLGEYESALTWCAEALDVYRELGDRTGEANTVDSIAFAHHQLGDHELAVRHFHEAIGIYRELGDRPYEATTLVKLGDTHVAAGDRTEADAAFHAALALFDELGHPEADSLRRRLGR